MQSVQVIEAPWFVRRSAQWTHRHLVWDSNPPKSALARARLMGGAGIALTGAATIGARALRRPVPVEVVVPPGLHLALDVTDALQLYLLLFGTWEPSQSALLQRIIGPDDTLIDIGAHLGYFSLLAASRGARVVAVEPNHDMLSRLRSNVTVNRFDDRIDILEAAVAADANGRVLYSGPQHNPGLSSTNPKWNLTNPQRVASIVARDLVDGERWASVKVVKVDVEGAEYEILEGLADVSELMPTDAVFLIELSPRWWPDRVALDEVLLPFTSRGFRVFSIENSYSPLRYMAPGTYWDPVEVRMPLREKRRYDLVLARDETRLRR